MGGLWTPGLWVPPPPVLRRRHGPEWGDEPYDWPGLRREPLRAAWSFVQRTGGAQGSGSSLAITVGSNITSGNRLIVVVYVYGAGITLSQVSDNLGNQGASAGKYDQVLVQADPFNGHIYLMTVPITTGGSCTVTATASGTASFISLLVAEYSGLSTATGATAGGSVVDVTASGNGTFATSMASGTTAATAAANELAVAAIGWTDVSNGRTVTSPGGWTERYSTSGASGGDIPLVVDDQTPANGAAVSATWAGSANDAGNGFAAGVAVFKLAGGTASSRSVTESVGPASDTVTRVFAGFRASTEAVGAASDAVTRAYAGGRTASEAVGPASDAVARQLARTSAIAESTGAAADSVVRVWTGTRTPTESLTHGDVVAAIKNAGNVAIGESWVIVDGVVKVNASDQDHEFVDGTEGAGSGTIWVDGKGE